MTDEQMRDKKEDNAKEMAGESIRAEESQKIEAIVEKLVARGMDPKEAREAVAALLKEAETATDHPELSSDARRELALEQLLQNDPETNLNLIKDVQVRIQKTAEKEHEREEKEQALIAASRAAQQGQQQERPLDKLAEIVLQPEKALEQQTGKTEPQPTQDKAQQQVQTDQAKDPQATKPDNKPQQAEEQKATQKAENTAKYKADQQNKTADKAKGGKPQRGGGGKRPKAVEVVVEVVTTVVQWVEETTQKLVDNFTKANETAEPAALTTTVKQRMANSSQDKTISANEMSAQAKTDAKAIGSSQALAGVSKPQQASDITASTVGGSNKGVGGRSA